MGGAQVTRRTAVRGLLVGLLAPGALVACSSAGAQAPTVKKLTVGDWLADPVVYVAHRGYSRDFTEMTLYAYDQCMSLGAKAIEVSVVASSQGTLWCSHDSTVGRETGRASRGAFDTFTDAQITALMVKGDLAADDPGQADRPFALFSDVLARYGGQVVMFVEDKTYKNTRKLITAMQTIPDYREKFIWKQAGPGKKFPQVTAAGLKSWGYYFDADKAKFSATQAQWDFVGTDYHSADALLASQISEAGTSRVIGHIIPTQAQATRLINLGVRGLMSATKTIVPVNPAR